MPKRMTVKIGDHKWSVRFSPKLQDYGHCEVTVHKDGQISRTIIVREGQTDAQLMDTLIHEALHAYYWDILTEKAVAVSSRDIAKLLGKVFRVSRK